MWTHCDSHRNYPSSYQSGNDTITHSWYQIGRCMRETMRKKGVATKKEGSNFPWQNNSQGINILIKKPFGGTKLSADSFWYIGFFIWKYFRFRYPIFSIPESLFHSMKPIFWYFFQKVTIKSSLQAYWNNSNLENWLSQQLGNMPSYDHHLIYPSRPYWVGHIGFLHRI